MVISYPHNSLWIFLREIRRGFSLGYVLNQLRYGFRRARRDIVGYRIKLKGRFSRRQMSTYICQKNGQVATGAQDVYTDHAATHISMLFGQCGIKVWIHRRRDNEKEVPNAIHSETN